MKGRFKLDIWGYITIGLLLLYGIFLVYPMVNLLRCSIFDSGTFTLEYFNRFFSKKYYFGTLMNSIKVTLGTTLVTLLLGAPLAYFFTMYTIKGSGILRVLIILSSMSAPFIGAYSWILLLGRSGVITTFLNETLHIQGINIYGFTGILLVLVLQLYPLTFLYLSGALKNIDQSLLEACQSLGCSGVKRFFKLILPLVMPTILASSLLVFMRALADFGTPMLIGEGYRTFPVLIYNEFMGEVSNDDGFAAAISIIAILVTTVIFMAQKYASNKLAFTMNALHPVEPKKLKGVMSLAVHLYAYLIVGLSTIPQGYVIYTSFLKTEGLVFKKGYWLGSYRTMISKLGSSIGNTFIIPGCALIIIILLAVLIAYLVVRRRSAATDAIDLISMMPYIIPGSVVGIAMLICFNRPPLVLSGTFIIMIAALVIRRLPYTIRSSVAILQQIPLSIEEASISLGTSKMRTFFTVTIPMMSNGIISGAILSWVTMITELSTAIILYTGKTRTLTISIYTEVIRGNYGVAAALSTVLTLLTVLSLLVFMKISKTKDIIM